MTEQMTVRACPNCGFIDVKDTHVKDHTEEYTGSNGVTVTSTHPVRFCNACGKDVYDQELDSASLDKVLEAIHGTEWLKAKKEKRAKLEAKRQARISRKAKS